MQLEDLFHRYVFLITDDIKNELLVSKSISHSISYNYTTVRPFIICKVECSIALNQLESNNLELYLIIAFGKIRARNGLSSTFVHFNIQTKLNHKKKVNQY